MYVVQITRVILHPSAEMGSPSGRTTPSSSGYRGYKAAERAGLRVCSTKLED